MRTLVRAWWRRQASRFLRGESGASAVEFALLGPVFIVMMAGIVELGGAVNTKLRIDSAITSASTYLLGKGASVNASSAETLAKDVLKMLEAELGKKDVAAAVTVNNGPTVTMTIEGEGKSGNNSGADSCYCPSKGDGLIQWGNAMTCGTACASGGFAGKYVVISASKGFVSLFPVDRFIKSDMLGGTAIVQVQ